MINLLPEEDQRRIRREYLRRLALTGCIVLAIAIGLDAFMLFPTLRFVGASAETVRAGAAVATVQRARADVQEVRTRVDELNTRISFLTERDAERVSIARIVERIRAERPAGVRLSGFRYEARGSEQDRLTVRGTTNDRRTIVVFVDRLRAGRGVIAVESPISNLLDNQDIAFAIDLTVSP